MKVRQILFTKLNTAELLDVQVGYRVVVFLGNHMDYNNVPASKVVKIEDERISFEDAAGSRSIKETFVENIPCTHS